MITNYIITAIRNFSRNRFFSVINLLGLSIGITASLLITLYIYNEFNYDKFHDKSDRIYRLDVVFKQQGSETTGMHSTAAMGPDLKREFPEIENMARLSTPKDAYLSYKEKSYSVKGITYADSSFFEVFSFKLNQGEPSKALSEPYSIVLSESTALKIFGDEDPLGNMLKMNNGNTFVVRGIVEDPPANSTIQYGALISFSTLYTYNNIYLSWDGGYGYITYLLLKENTSPEQVYEHLSPFLEDRINEKYRKVGVELDLLFEPLMDLHLFSKATGEGSSLSKLMTFSAVAFLILLIACVNFMNLSTARSAKRAKEAGVRKVLGGTKSSLRWQFLSEALMMSFLATVLALILVEILQPLFNNLIGKQLNLYDSENIVLLVFLFFLTIIIGLISGSYPAFYLSVVKPVKVLKGGWFSPRGKTLFRNVLVVFQFFITIVLIISTIVIYKQIGYLKNADLGFEKDQIIYLPLLSSDAKNNTTVLKNEFSSLPFVNNVGASSAMPGWNFTRNGYFPEGYEEPVMINVVDVDEDFLRTMGVDIIQGTGFSASSEFDDDQYLVNTALAKEFGWKEPLGKEIRRGGSHKIIGVVEDFNFAPLYIKVLPLIITNKPWDGFNYLAINMKMDDPEEHLKQLENKWKQTIPGEPFVYQFLDQQLETVYRNEKNFGKLFLYFSVLAIFIACLGLLGLAAYMVEQRTREIGIRKVFGASEFSVVRLLSWDFSKLVLLANALAWPVAWYFMNNWIARFAYQTKLSPWIFVASGLIAFIIAFITVFYQSSKAANTNPAEVMKYE